MKGFSFLLIILGSEQFYCVLVFNKTVTLVLLVVHTCSHYIGCCIVFSVLLLDIFRHCVSIQYFDQTNVNIKEGTIMNVPSILCPYFIDRFVYYYIDESMKRCVIRKPIEMLYNWIRKLPVTLLCSIFEETFLFKNWRVITKKK